jgi:hypothetical protein
MATVLGGLMPHSVLSPHPGLPYVLTSPARTTVGTLAEEPPVTPIGCLTTSCGHGNPTPAIPSLIVAGLLAAAGFAFALTRPRWGRDPRLALAVLPRGASLVLFHPPQFS